MGSDDFLERRLETAWVQASKDEHGVCRVTWLPHEPDEHGRLSGRTFSPGDGDLPDDFPVSDDLEDYLSWAVRRWGP